jgi:general secretion pathway protein F
MPIYLYKALTASGETLIGEIDAPSKSIAIDRLQHAGHIPLSAVEKKGKGKSSFLDLKKIIDRDKVSAKDITLVTRELSTLLQAGLALDHALTTLEEISPHPALKKMLANINQQVKGGEPLSTAMEAQGQTFSKLYLNTIRAGEAGGSMHVVLERLADYLERTDELRNEVLSALLYPAILFMVAILSIFILLSFVVPQFVPLFEDVGQALPLLTQIVFTSAEFIQSYWWVILAAVIFFIWIADKKLQNPVTRMRWDDWCLDVPLYGELITKLDVARFSRTLGTLLINGVPLLISIGIVKDVVSNRVLARTINEAAKGLEQGRGLAKHLAQSDRFPQLAIQLIHVGEETGQLESMLLKTADIYDDESKTTIKRLLTLLEPVLILGLGAIIAIIIISILMAILGLNELVI